MLSLEDPTTDCDTLLAHEVYFLSEARCLHNFDDLPVSIFVFFKAILCFFAINVLVTSDVVCVNSVTLKHIDCLRHFLGLYQKVLNLNFIKLAQFLINGDKNPNPGIIQNDCKSPRGLRKKIKVLKRTLKAFDLSKNGNVSVSSDPELRNEFLIKFNLPT